MRGQRGAVRLAALAALATVVACSDGDRPRATGTGTPSVPPTATATGDPAGDGAAAAGRSLPELVQELEPSVVTVLVAGAGGQRGQGQGSGVVYRADGVIVTNEHVVRDARQVVVAFADGQRVAAEVVAADRLADVAVLRVERDDLPVPEYRTDLPEVGERAIVIGSPLGFAGSVTAGIISGLGRDIPGSAAIGSQALVDLIQTDAPISPGNSGGPLIDDRGRVVGLSEAVISPATGAAALGFAIPAQTVVRVADQLLADGRAQHAYLGVQFGRLTPQIAQQLEVEREGALVLGVADGGPAARAGVEPGDVVVEAAGERVRTVEDVLGVLRGAAPGDRLALTVVREGEERALEVVVDDRPR